MVNIEIRQNGKFEFGYPYNSSIDAYFQHLPEDFISNYDLSDVEVNKINDHKNKVFTFDKTLYEFIIKLSAFIKEFNTHGQVTIDTYDTIKQSQSALQDKLDKLIESSKKTDDEYKYMTENINTLKTDLSKVEEFIKFYESQLVDETYVYNDTYVEETKDRLEIIDAVISTNNEELLYYENVLEEKIIAYTETLKAISNYHFKATSLRELYEAWQARPEEYYQRLVQYFADEYNALWTYGQSLMYSENIKKINAAKELVKEIAAITQSKLFKQKTLEIEKEIKTFSLLWLNENKTFEPIDFTITIEKKRSDLLESMISELEDIILMKDSKVKNIISYTMHKNYYKYQELIQAKRKYIYMNIMNGIDVDVLKRYDDEIDSLENDYKVVKARLEQPTYWILVNDLERHRELLIDLKRRLSIVTLALSRDFQKGSGSNDDLLKKIDYYHNEEIELNKKITDIIKLKDKLEITGNVYRDEITILKAKIFEMDQTLLELENSYTLEFEQRISFYTQNFEQSQKDGIKDLMNGKFYNELNLEFNDILSYSSPVIWYDVDDRTKLFNVYSVLLEKIDKLLREQWYREFSPKILSKHKITYYKTFFDEKLLTIYGLIHHFVQQDMYNDEAVDNIYDKIDEIKIIFGEYLELAFETKSDITVATDIFNYDKEFRFYISQDIETKENILHTFNSFLDIVTQYVSAKNLDFKLRSTAILNELKINAVWNDMEKKYV